MTKNTFKHVSTDKKRTSDLVTSRRIAGLIGPVLIAIVISELEFLQPHLYDGQIPPVVYFSGTLFFVAGLAIVRAHNRWSFVWPVLITLMGWLAMFLALVRMFAASAYSQNVPNPSVILSVQVILLVVGIVLSFNAYWPKEE